MRAYHAPGTVLSILHTFTQSILTMALQSPLESGFCSTILICSMLFSPRAGARLVSEETPGKPNKNTDPPTLRRLVELETENMPQRHFKQDSS